MARNFLLAVITDLKYKLNWRPTKYYTVDSIKLLQFDCTFNRSTLQLVIMVNWNICLPLSLIKLASFILPVVSNKHFKKPTSPGEIMPLSRRKFTNSRGALISSSLPLGKLLFSSKHRNFIWSSSSFVISSAICTKKALNSASFVRICNGVRSTMLVDGRSTRTG